MATDRQLEILHFLAIHNEVEVGKLSELFHVSPSTIRRELRVLEENGLLVRTHGGAKLPMPIHYFVPYEKRVAQQVEEKRMIALAAMRLVKPGMIIGIMGGTTCTELARLLRPMEQLTIVTNAINVALELQGQLARRVMVTGGMLNQNSYELVGSLTTQSLKNVYIDLAFLGVNGISPEYGFSMSDEPEATVARAFMSAAKHTMVVADHTKIGKTTFARLCPLSEVDLLITDANSQPAQQRAVEQAGVKLLIAKGSIENNFGH